MREPSLPQCHVCSGDMIVEGTTARCGTCGLIARDRRPVPRPPREGTSAVVACGPRTDTTPEPPLPPDALPPRLRRPAEGTSAVVACGRTDGESEPVMKEYVASAPAKASAPDEPDRQATAPDEAASPVAAAATAVVEVESPLSPTPTRTPSPQTPQQQQQHSTKKGR